MWLWHKIQDENGDLHGVAFYQIVDELKEIKQESDLKQHRAMDSVVSLMPQSLCEKWEGVEPSPVIHLLRLGHVDMHKKNSGENVDMLAMDIELCYGV